MPSAAAATGATVVTAAVPVYHTTAPPAITRPIEGKDPCNMIVCPRLCTDDCGWSLARGVCVAGLLTEPHEMAEGNCSAVSFDSTPATGTATPTSTAAAARNTDGGNTDTFSTPVLIVLVVVALIVAVGCCAMGLVCLRKRSYRELDENSAPKPSMYANPAYETSPSRGLGPPGVLVLDQNNSVDDTHEI